MSPEYTGAMKVAELAEQTTKEFGKVWDRFASLEVQMATMREEIIDEIEKRFDPKFDRIFAMLDSIIKTNEDHKLEMAMINRQGRRHENWIHQLADKTDTKLEY